MESTKMGSEKVERVSAGRRIAIAAKLGSAMGLVLLFSLGIVDRNAPSSRPQKTVAVESVRGSEASGVAAQADSDSRESLPGHPELDLQLD